MKETFDLLKELCDRIAARYRIAMATGVVTGTITHLFMITNKITNADDLTCVPAVGGGEALGRWMQVVFHIFFSDWSVPALNGMMSVILLSVVSCLLVCLLDVRSVTGAVLVPLMVVTMPSAASNMYYMYLTPVFATAILMSVLGVLLTLRFRFGWIGGVLLQFFSMACYQAYFGFATALYVLVLILFLMDGKPVAEAAKAGVRALLALAVSMAAYLVSIKLGGELYDYKGLDSIGKTGAADYLQAVLRAYHRVLQYFLTKPESYMTGAPALFNRILAVLLVTLFVVVLVQRGFGKDKPRLVSALILSVIIFPLSLGLVYVMAPELSQASTVMTYCYVVFDLAVIGFAERIRPTGASEKTKKMLTTVLVCVTAAVLLFEAYACYRVINAAYYRSYIAQTRITQYYNRLIARIEAEEGFQYGDRVAILGGFYPESVPVGWHSMDGWRFEDMEGVPLEDHLFLSPLRTRYIEIFFGMYAPYLDEEASDHILTSSEFQAMESYPAKDCVRRIDDIWVLKIGEDDR